MSQQTPKRPRTTGPSGDDQAGPSSGTVSQITPDPRALARSEQEAAKLSATDLKKLEIELARYILFADKKKVPIKKTDIVKNVLKENSRLLPSIMEGARRYLKQAFGYSICEVDHNKNKYYLVRNNIELPELQQLTRPAHALPQLALLTILLSLIHMANNALDEEDLWETLKILGIDKSDSHVDFGDTEKLVNEFVRQMYVEKQKVTTSKGLVMQYKWGMRAYHEVRMTDILQFVASIYDVDVGVWKKQFSSHIGAMQVS